MATEEVKFDLRVQQSQSGQGTASVSGTKSSTASNVFEEFKKYAKKQGIEITQEQFQEFLNANPDLSTKSPEEQNKLFNKFLSDKKLTPSDNNSDSAEATNASDTDSSEVEQKQAAEAENATAQTTEPEKTSKNIFTVSNSNIFAVQQTPNATQAEKSEATEEAAPAEKTEQATNKATKAGETQQAEESAKAQEAQASSKASKAPITPAETKPAEENAQAEKTENNDSKTDKKDETLTEYYDKQQGENFDTKTYSEKLTKSEMQGIYTREYAKNLYMFTNEEQQDISAWNKLEESEKEKYIKQAEEALSKDITFAGAMDNEITAKISLNSRMLKLQAANQMGMSLEKFNKLDSNEQNSIIYEMLDLKRKINSKYAKSENEKDYDYSKFSAAERMFMDKEDTSLSALKFYAEKKGIKSDNLCHEDIHRFAESNKVNMAVATKEYLTEKAKSGELKSLEKIELKALNSLPAEYIQAYGTESGPSIVDNEIASDKKYGEKFNSASPELRQVYKIQYITEKYSNDPAKVKELILDEVKHSNIETAIATHALASDNEQLSKELANERNQTISTLNMSGLGHLQPEHMSVAVKVSKSMFDDKTIANVFADYGIKTVSDKDLSEAAKATGSQLQSQYAKDIAMSAIFKRANACEKTDDGVSAIKAATENASQDCINEAAMGTIGSPHELEYGTAYAENNGKTAAYMIEHGIPSKYKVENQTPMFQVLQTSVEENLPKDEAIHALGNLSDQIAKCDSANQLAMHKQIMQSKYSEVVNHAAENIYKYDASVQAEAIKITFATGNIAAIEKVLVNIDKMDASAIRSIQAEVKNQLEAMEERHYGDILNDYATRKLSKELAGISPKSPEYTSKLKAYIEELKKLPQSEIYQRICSDFKSWPTSVQTVVLDKIAKYSPKLLSMFIDKYGVELLTAFGQINIATKNQILKEMLKTPSKRAEAMEYIKSNIGGNFSDSVKDLYNRILAEMEGDDYDKIKRKEQESDEQVYQTVPTGFGSQTGSTRTNLHRNDTFWKTKANLNYYLA